VEHEIGEEKRRRRLTAVDRGALAKLSSGEENRNAGARDGIEERKSLLGAFPS
jgi:hypothetical protein